jgi:uncharacterized protein DUF3987
MSARDGAAGVRRIVDEAEELKPEPPRPLMRELPPADPFPVEALGDVLAPATSALHDRVRAPIAIGAQSTLGAAALAVQSHADVDLPIGGGSGKPVSCYFVTVAATGERKSECDRQALWPVEKHEAALRANRDRDLPAYTNDKAAWDRAREVAIRAGRGNRAAIKNALDDLGPAPVAPLDPILTCPEPTFEGLCKLFATGWPSLGIFATEGGQFIGGHGMSQDNKLKTAAGLSEVWDGKPIRRVRSGDGATVLPGRRLSAHLMVQPAVADILFRDCLLAEQGLLSRWLPTAPDTAAGTRLWREEQIETDRDIKRYGARLLAILETPMPLRAGTANELATRRMPLSQSARKLWIRFADHVERAIAPNGALEPIRGFANKVPEHAARLAGIVTLVRDIEAGEIVAAEIEAGIALAEHYAAEALRLFGSSRANADLRLSQRLLDWLLGTWHEPAISLPDIYQRSLNAIGDRGTAEKLVNILEEHGWLVKIPQGAVVAGQRRRDAWLIVRG